MKGIQQEIDEQDKVADLVQELKDKGTTRKIAMCVCRCGNRHFTKGGKKQWQTQ